VFFRDSTRRRADELGVAGWVRNRDDGAVEGIAEGEEEAVAALLDYVRSGPGRAVVDDLEVIAADPEGSEGFQIR
jgi:acylphosphatase